MGAYACYRYGGKDIIFICYSIIKTNEDYKMATTTMQARLNCKHASVPRGSLDVDLSIDENLTLKPPHHYLVKLCKNVPGVSTVGSLSKGPQGSLARLHLRHACTYRAIWRVRDPSCRQPLLPSCRQPLLRCLLLHLLSSIRLPDQGQPGEPARAVEIKICTTGREARRF
jgi:hypothetical protein